MATAERIRGACELLLRAGEAGVGVGAVVSAIGNCDDFPVKVTDVLLTSIGLAERKDPAYAEELQKVIGRYTEVARELLEGAEGGEAELAAFLAGMEEDSASLGSMLGAVSLVGCAAGTMEDFIVGHGEIWNSRLVAAALRTMGAAGAVSMDARDIIVVSPSDDGSVDVDWQRSGANFAVWSRENGLDGAAGCSGGPVVMTGFIARCPDGLPTTLKRNGSDYSATILGALLEATGSCQRITIWTDVDGVFSADPRKVPSAEPLDSLSYEEAWEMAYFGASVLHPRASLPAMRYKIPIGIRNFFNQNHAGTTIKLEEKNENYCSMISSVVKGVATISDCSLISIAGTGMIGVPGTASRIFSAMRDEGINVIMISQGSSEHSVCFGVQLGQAPQAVQRLKEAFRTYLENGTVHEIESIDDCSILAAVGSQMTGQKGISARLFAALAEADVNVRATAQGCSEHNISVVIARADKDRALLAVHDKFYSLKSKYVTVGLVGAEGPEGTAVAEEVGRHLRVNAAGVVGQDTELQLKAVEGGGQMALLSCARNEYEGRSWEAEEGWEGGEGVQALDREAFLAHLQKGPADQALVIDCGGGSGSKWWAEAGVAVLPAAFILGLN